MMGDSLEFCLNKASEAEIADHLMQCDTDFVPRLSSRVTIKSYAQKLVSKASRFEAWSGETLVGLVAMYCNNQENHLAYITNVSVLGPWTGKGIGFDLMSRCIQYAKASDIQKICLEVYAKHTSAMKLYEKIGFVADEDTTSSSTMNFLLKIGENNAG